MINFDFHNLLFPSEFERLCRDILEIRESPTKFTTYKQGKDGGIDIKSTTNESKKIIGQCKLYNPNNYNSLLNTLKNNELKKCKKQKPDRYLLCINIKLSSIQAEEILKIFKGYILNEEDIIDGEKLNKYLGQEKYQHLLKTYSKLLVPNIHFIKQVLDQVLNKKYYNQTKSFVDNISLEHKLFHNTQTLKQCIDILEQNNVLILTGNPGVGKTTTAKMITNYFIHKKVSNVLFLSDFNFGEIEGLLQDNQLIVIDDFWGQNFSTKLKDNLMMRNFTRIISNFKKSCSNRYLVLTSREYIIRDVLNNAEFETKEILKNKKFLINLEEYSKEDKTRIFLNHLLFYDFEKSYFTYLKYDNILERIINHKNYSPRHIEYFVKQYLSQNDKNYFKFYSSFLKYLDNPQEYWNDNFKKLNDTSQLIVLIVLISSDPISFEDLKKTFYDTQISVRTTLNKEIKPLEFDNEIRLLEDFYLIRKKQADPDPELIYFQSPGIKDYLLEYLRSEGKFWIQPLIEKAIFFNQLNFIFSTHDEDINDYDFDSDLDTTLYGKKIILSEEVQKLLKNKLLKEFSDLNFCSAEEKEFYGEFSGYHTSEETKYWKLYLLNNLFDINKESNLDVRSFILDEVTEDIDRCLKGGNFIDSCSMSAFPRVIEIIKPYFQRNPIQLLKLYFENIIFTHEFSSLYDFKKIFSTEFDIFIKDNITKIRKQIKYLIIDNIDYYACYDMYDELDKHFEYRIKNVCREYGIRFTSKFNSEIEEMVDFVGYSNYFSIQEKIKTSKKVKKVAIFPYKKWKSKKHNIILEEYISDEHYETDFNAIQYLKSSNVNKNLIKIINNDLKKEDSILKPFSKNQIMFSEIINFIQKDNININCFDKYIILDKYFNYYCNSKNLDIEILKKIFFNLTNDSFDYDFSITQTRLRKIFKENKIVLSSLNTLSPIIIPNKNWFDFSCYDFKLYFITEYLNSIQSIKFKDKIKEYSSKLNHGADLLNYLEYSNKKSFFSLILIPELERFINIIDKSSEKSIFLSILHFFNIEFNLVWNKKDKKFYSDYNSNSEFFFETITEYLELDFSTMDMDIYFTKNWQTKTDIQKYFINTKIYTRLYKKIISLIPLTKEKDIFNKENETYFKINLYEFVSDNENYFILKNIGMEKYILTLYYKLFDVMHDIKKYK